MKTLKGRIIAAVIAFTVIIAIVISFSVIGKIDVLKTGGYSETFTGGMSASSYRSKEAAARGFVTEELTGASATPSYAGYKKTGELTENEITEIIEQNPDDAQIQSGEKVEIEFVNNDTKSSVNAYLLEEENDCRYYVLPPAVGEPVTNTYLNSVLDGEKYLNCTATTVVGLSIFDIMTTYSQIIKFDNDKAHFNQGLPGLVSNIYMEESNRGLNAYLENSDLKDGKLYSYSQLQSYYSSKGYSYVLYLSKGGNKIPLSSLTCMQDITEFVFMLDIDASYFIKTANGFSMPNDKYKAVCKMIAGESFADELDKIWEDYKIYFRSDYFVSEGRLSKSETVIRLLEDDKLVSVSVTTSYTNFGTTEVIIPER